MASLKHSFSRAHDPHPLKFMFGRELLMACLFGLVSCCSSSNEVRDEYILLNQNLLAITQLWQVKVRLPQKILELFPVQ